MAVGHMVALDDLADLGRAVLAERSFFPGGVGRHRVRREAVVLEPRMLTAQAVLELRRQVRQREGLLIRTVTLEAAVALLFAVAENLARLAADRGGIHGFMLPERQAAGESSAGGAFLSCHWANCR